MKKIVKIKTLKEINSFLKEALSGKKYAYEFNMLEDETIKYDPCFMKHFILVAYPKYKWYGTFALWNHLVKKTEMAEKDREDIIKNLNHFYWENCNTLYK